MLHLKRISCGALLLSVSCYLLLVLVLLVFPEHRISISSDLRRPLLNNLVRDEAGGQVSFDRCWGKRVYVYNLPAQLNEGLVKKCDKQLVCWLDFCRHLENYGFGQAIDRSAGWYATDAYMLEVIFHSRIRNYSCLTNDSSRADALFVPYYAGFDALQYLYSGGCVKTMQDRHGVELAKWLEKQAGDAWKRWNGRDHFMVMGRTSWDFAVARGSWGTGIQGLDHVANMTTLYIERNPWKENQVAVPYPTSFHPSNATQLNAWIRTVATSRRKYLLSFSGGIRATMKDATSVRSTLLRQCQKRAELCVHVDCGGSLKCGHDPRPSVAKFLESEFCLQPRGDTATRRSAFDAIISGCIPVFFHHDSAYSQYVWHLPSDPGSYSVFIAEESITGGGVDVVEFLSSLPGERILELRSSVVSLIPRLIYRMPGGENGSGFEDAFDVSLREVLRRITGRKAGN
ncbi:galactosyltransferase-like protein [Selaginella moellendorffii]|uniref:Galactosyltransferase-like protein n=2 Tax=Selaginella moellendorffii TaxID=88036 RepID=D8SWE5_SELML|nr:galactosyltransferase-like protein [Selaginella moellendorffii]